MDSYQATLYTRWYLEFQGSLLVPYFPEYKDRIAFFEHDHEHDFFYILLNDVREKREESRF